MHSIIIVAIMTMDLLKVIHRISLCITNMIATESWIVGGGSENQP
jgi:hypothetical protein